MLSPRLPEVGMCARHDSEASEDIDLNNARRVPDGHVSRNRRVQRTVGRVESSRPAKRPRILWVSMIRPTLRVIRRLRDEPASRQPGLMGVHARMKRAAERLSPVSGVQNSICPAVTLRHHICKRRRFPICVGVCEWNATWNRILT